MADQPVQRPDDVPTAMREAFGTSRVASSWETFARSKTDVERLAALAGFERLLAKRGLELADVAEAVLKLPEGRPQSFEQAFAGFGDVFSHMRPRGEAPVRPQAAKPAQPRSNMPRTIHQGADIPATASGMVDIVDQRPSRTGAMLVFNLKTDSDVYGPIVAFSQNHILALLEAVEEKRRVGVGVKQPEGPRHMPSVRFVQ